MKRSAYPQYKPSGVEYLGDVPAHWDVRRLKTLCTRSALYGANVATSLYADAGVRYIRTTDITDDGALKKGGVFLPNELVFDYLLADGDILLSRSGTVGRSFLYNPKLHGSCAYAGYLVRFTPSSQTLPQYLFRFTKTQSFSIFLRTMAISSTIDNVNAEKYANVFLPIPPLPEQTAIVDFLNRETGKTDALVEKKAALIARLKEKRGALISRTVTRGLAPDAPMKDSGLAYLGEVPVEWTVQRLKQTLAKIYSGGTPDTGNEVFWSDDDSGIPWVAIADMSATRNLKSTAKRITEEGRQSKQLPILPRGTILYSMYASLGKVAVLEIPATVNQAILGMIPSADKLTRGYLSYWLHNMERHILLMSSSNTQSNLNAEKVRNMPIYLPSLSEQADIVDFLNRETGKIDTLIAKVEETIERLKEHRAALISAAVTGQIDVRSAK